MIVQTAPDGEKHFVITMDQHTALSAQFAEHYGNEGFEAVEPRVEMVHMIGHHDAGWRELDATALRDPSTGLPYNLVETPFEHLIKTGSASPDFNGAFHAYCELMSSMHCWGLYNGRYGMSDKVLLDGLAENNRAVADTMLDHEFARQQSLKSTLDSDPETATWIEESHLFQNYKQLQFFDTFALYFNCVHESEREKASFIHVPMSATEDTKVAIEPVGDGVYAMDPYPFNQDFDISFDGRYLAPVSEGDDVRSELEQAPIESQAARLIAKT